MLTATVHILGKIPFETDVPDEAHVANAVLQAVNFHVVEETDLQPEEFRSAELERMDLLCRDLEKVEFSNGKVVYPVDIRHLLDAKEHGAAIRAAHDEEYGQALREDI